MSHQKMPGGDYGPLHDYIIGTWRDLHVQLMHEREVGLIENFCKGDIVSYIWKAFPITENRR